MALIKEKTYKGVGLNYHKIKIIGIDDDNLSLTAQIRSYPSRDYSKANRNSFLCKENKTLQKEGMTRDEFEALTILQLYQLAYQEIVKSNIQTQIDIDGNESEVETNFWVDATHDIETETN